MDSIINIFNRILGFLTGQDLPSFVYGIRTVFVIVTIVIIALMIYFRIRSGVYGDRTTAWKWKWMGFKKYDE